MNARVRVADVDLNLAVLSCEAGHALTSGAQRARHTQRVVQARIAHVAVVYFRLAVNSGEANGAYAHRTVHARDACAAVLALVVLAAVGVPVAARSTPAGLARTRVRGHLAAADALHTRIRLTRIERYVAQLAAEAERAYALEVGLLLQARGAVVAGRGLTRIDLSLA